MSTPHMHSAQRNRQAKLSASHGWCARIVVLAAFALALPVSAQQVAQQAPTPRPQIKGANPASKDASPASDSALRQRVDQLEEQLVDMQVTIGTLESLAKGATAPAGVGTRPNAAAALNASDAGRLDGLETQIRALAAQLEQLQDQVRALGGRSGALVTSPNQALNDQGPRPGRAQIEEAQGQGERTGFGSMTVSQRDGQRDEIQQLIGRSQEQGAQTGPQEETHMAGLPPVPGQLAGQLAGQLPGQLNAEINPKQLYETAYGYLLQRDYGAAETAFDDFLRRNPNDPLAGNAQYWLGESLYVRGQYRAAANAFLKGYQSYAKSAKAPESLLKLAMSLQRLGQKEAACSSLGELATKFPNVAAHVKTTAQAERQRAGCS
jgi:tol-pal system protein YbgF